VLGVQYFRNLMLYDLTKHHVWSAIKGYVRRKEVGYKRQLQMRTKEGGKRWQAQKRKKGDDGRRRGTRAPYRSPHRRIRKHSPISNLGKNLSSNQERQLCSNCQEDRFVRQKLLTVIVFCNPSALLYKNYSWMSSRSNHPP